MLVCAFSKASNAHETAGAARTRSSPRPLSRVACASLLRRERNDKTRAKPVARTRTYIHSSSRPPSRDPYSAYGFIERLDNNATSYGSRLKAGTTGLRANGSGECPPDDNSAKQSRATDGALDCFANAARNDGEPKSSARRDRCRR